MRGVFGKITIIALASLAWTSSAFAENCSKMRSRWDQKYFGDFGVVWERDDFPCDGMSHKLSEGLALLESLKFKKGPDFYKYAANRIGVTYYSVQPNSGDTDKATALAIAWERFLLQGGMTLYPSFAKDSIIGRAETVVHEARHTMHADRGHVKCSHGTMKDSRSCDAKFYNGQWKGSGYNMSFVFIAWLLNGSSYGDAIDRRLMRSRMEYLLANHFNSISAEELARWSQKK